MVLYSWLVWWPKTIFTGGFTLTYDTFWEFSKFSGAQAHQAKVLLPYVVLYSDRKDFSYVWISLKRKLKIFTRDTINQYMKNPFFSKSFSQELNHLFHTAAEISIESRQFWVFSTLKQFLHKWNCFILWKVLIY